MHRNLAKIYDFSALFFAQFVRYFFLFLGIKGLNRSRTSLGQIPRINLMKTSRKFMNCGSVLACILGDLLSIVFGLCDPGPRVGHEAPHIH